jgi:putative mRNA 3-end processing factor
LAYGDAVFINGVRVSLHPAGHVLGSAQVRIEHLGQVWCASGDYFLRGADSYNDSHNGSHNYSDTPDNPTCSSFEPVRCHCFITESTFGLPIYRWQPPQHTMAGIKAWWQANAANNRPSLLLAYSFGKAQRVLAGVVDAASSSPGPLVVHGAVEPLNAAYCQAGVALPATCTVDQARAAGSLGRALVVAPPAVRGSAWAQKLGDSDQAFASGWMQLRGARRRQGVDKGFVLSDHADWPGLQRAVAATGASRVIVTHGYEAVMVRWLQQQGLQASSFKTEFGGDDGEANPEANSETLYTVANSAP